MKHSTFFLDVYQIRVHLLWDVSTRELNQFVREKVNANFRSAGSFEGVCVWFRGGDTVTIGLRKWKGSTRDIAILSHEVFHAVSWIMREAGIKMCIATEECAGYLTEAIMRRCLNKIYE